MSEELLKAQPRAKNEHLDFMSLAAVMASDEDVTKFRRFDALNVFNLLVLQDEIHRLNEQFEKMRHPRHDRTEIITPRLPGIIRSWPKGRSKSRYGWTG